MSHATRRLAGTAGLGSHLDPGTLDLWLTRGYQQVFRHLFDGTVEQYDPWDATYRSTAPQYPGTTMCSAFRTFQGWTAISDMPHDQGVMPTQRAVRAQRPGSLSYRVQPQRLPGRALRAHRANRFQVADLSETGRRGLGLA